LYSLDVPSRARGPSSPKGLGPLAAALRARIGSTAFNAWFVGAGIADSTEDSVTLELPNSFKATQAENKFGSDVLACLQAQQSTIERVRFVGRSAA
jgi:chromosomal replication initiation ATPase DnaA